MKEFVVALILFCCFRYAMPKIKSRKYELQDVAERVEEPF